MILEEDEVIEGAPRSTCGGNSFRLAYSFSTLLLNLRDKGVSIADGRKF